MSQFGRNRGRSGGTTRSCPAATTLYSIGRMAVLHSPTDDQVAAQVSLRASHSVEDQVAETAPATMAQLYGQLAGGSSPVVTIAVSLAEAICRQVPEGFQDVSLTEINAVAPGTGQLVSSVNLVLTIVADQLGFSPSILNRVTARTSVWTRGGCLSSRLPVASTSCSMTPVPWRRQIRPKLRTTWRIC